MGVSAHDSCAAEVNTLHGLILSCDETCRTAQCAVLARIPVLQSCKGLLAPCAVMASLAASGHRR